MVDRLLASHQYGERWGRIWLDVARYGEDDYRSLDPMRRGFNPYPNAHVYRDWVIQAINDDMPYDQFVKAQIAGDLLDEKVRHKTIPATGFLGLGPWYYDNGSVEVTRADERHDRVDVVTRGFLGLTVACARCHDHKYDPIPQKDYYSLAGVFYNTQYEEYPLAPKAVTAKYADIEARIDSKQKIMGEMQTNLSNQLSQTLALQTANYLQAVWEVTGPQKKEMAAVVETRKLDYELLDRWMKYMAKPTEKYKNKDAWQAMMKRPASTAADAKRLADKFQEEVVAVMLARNETQRREQGHHRQGDRRNEEKEAHQQAQQLRHQRRLLPRLRPPAQRACRKTRTIFWTEIFQREVTRLRRPERHDGHGQPQGKPGVLLFRGWGLESRVGAEAQAQIAAIRTDIEAERKKLEPVLSLHPRREGPARNPVDLPLAIRGNPENLGDDSAAPLPQRSLHRRAEALRKGSGRLELAEEIVKQPIAMRVIVNRIWKGHFGTGIVDTPSNFGITGERPTNPELLEYLASTFVEERHVHQEAASRDHAEFRVSAQQRQRRSRLLQRTPATASTGALNRKRMDAEQLRDSVLFVSGNLDNVPRRALEAT